MKLKAIKGSRSYNQVIEEMVFKRMDKLDIILKNEKAIKKLAGHMKEFAAVMGRKVEDYDYNADDWIIEEKKIENTRMAEEKPKEDHSKLGGFKTADQV